MNESRIALQHKTAMVDGTQIVIGGSKYTITGLKSDVGASCLVYDAERETSFYESKIGMPPVPAVIKEFYPLDLADSITRNCDGLNVLPASQYEFNERRLKFERGARKQVEFYGKGSNHSFAPSRIDVSNNTVYSVVDSAQGDTLDKIFGLKLERVAQVMASLCEAVAELHDRELLHLDIKPSNIYLFANNGILSNRVALFDFDTVMSLDEIENGSEFISYSEGWATHEQIRQIRKGKDKIGYSTDLYAIGAVLFWAVTGQMVTNHVLTQIKMKDFSFLDNIEALDVNPSAKESIQHNLYAMLRRFPSERRVKTIWEAIDL